MYTLIITNGRGEEIQRRPFFATAEAASLEYERCMTLDLLPHAAVGTIIEGDMEEGYVQINEVVGGKVTPLVTLPATEVIDAVYSHALWATEGYYYAEGVDDDASYYVDHKGHIEWVHPLSTPTTTL